MTWVVSEHLQFGVFPYLSRASRSCFFFPLPHLPCSHDFLAMADTAQKRKEAATEPTPDIRTSTRAKTASSKQREISGSSFSLLFPVPYVSRCQDEQTGTEAQKEIERLKQQLTKHKKKNQQLAEIVQGNPHLYHSPGCPG